LVSTPFSAAIGHRGTEPGGYFCLKLTLTCTPDPIRPTRQGPDPNRPTNGSKQGGLWLRGVYLGGTPPETIGDSRTEFNRILCTSKSEAAVTSTVMKKLYCRYVEADYRQIRSFARPLCDSWASCFLVVVTPQQPMLSMLQWRHYVLALSIVASVHPVFRLVPNIFILLWTYTERISTKFAGGNHYHEQVKC